MEILPAGSDRLNPGILVPTDFSKVCENALLHGLELAHGFQCDVCLLHVLPPQTEPGLTGDVSSREKAQHKLKVCRERYARQFPMKTDLMVREGNLFKEIFSVVAGTRPLMMVLGTHGKQGLQHIFGSHALRVVLDAACPVLVVRKPPPENGYLHILVPVDCELDPARVIEWVLRLCKITIPEVSLFLSREVVPERQSRIKEIVARIISGLKQRNIRAGSGKAKFPDEFGSQVVIYAHEQQPDLIMTMSMPGSDNTGFDFSAWNERLMFSQDGFSVLFIDRTDQPG